MYIKTRFWPVYENINPELNKINAYREQCFFLLFVYSYKNLLIIFDLTRH